MSKNLLSVQSITKNGGKITFEGGKATVSFNGKQVFYAVENDTSLFMVKLRPVIRPNQIFLASEHDKKSNCMLWHRRLGHLSSQNIKKLLKMSAGIKST